MSVSKEEFAAIAKQLAAQSGRIVSLNVDGFSIEAVIASASGKRRYTSYATYDPVKGVWQGVNYYGNNVLPALTRRISDALNMR